MKIPFGLQLDPSYEPGYSSVGTVLVFHVLVQVSLRHVDFRTDTTFKPVDVTGVMNAQFMTQ